MNILNNGKPLTVNILDLMLAVGLAFIAGSIIFLAMVGIINKAYLLTAIVEAFPVIMTGVIIIWVGVKLSERWE